MTGAGGVAPQHPASAAPRPQGAARRQGAPRLKIDWTRCDGHGLCAALLPGGVTRDEWGYPVIDDDALDAVPAAAVNRAITACPALALRR